MNVRLPPTLALWNVRLQRRRPRARRMPRAAVAIGSGVTGVQVFWPPIADVGASAISGHRRSPIMGSALAAKPSQSRVREA
jgi:hypothetical protein